jgi:hypothetical protein
MKRLEFIGSRVMPEAFADAPQGITVIDSGLRTAALQADVLTWADFVIKFTSEVSAIVVGSFIYDSIKKGSKKAPKTIAINKTEIEFERGKIVKFIETQVTETTDDS